MAISVESIVNVRRKVFNRLSGGTGGDPFAHEQFRALFSYLSQHAQNPDLQYVPFAAADVIVTDDGRIIADAACKVYAVWAKKAATNDTNAFLAMFDNPVDDCDGGTDMRLVLPFLTASDTAIWIKKDGLPMAAGIVLVSYTDGDGLTTSAAADAQNGFVLLGNA